MKRFMKNGRIYPMIDEQRYYLVEKLNLPGTSSFALENTEIFRHVKPGHLAFAGITGYHFYQWYQESPILRTLRKAGSRMRKNGCCTVNLRKIWKYPKIRPAVIIGVTDGNRILMSKYAGRAYKKYALIAGFTEIGETVEETVKREVMEEVGLKVKNIRYKRVSRGLSATLYFGFYRDLDGTDRITLRRRRTWRWQKWFDRKDIPGWRRQRFDQ